jgi:general stress protein YciG
MPGTESRGFASMDAERQRSIASKGGRAAHMAGKAHEFTSEEARIAGSRGGVVVSSDREHMSIIGSKGGQNHGMAWREKQAESKSVDAKRGEKDEAADTP